MRVGRMITDPNAAKSVVITQAKYEAGKETDANM